MRKGLPPLYKSASVSLFLLWLSLRKQMPWIEHKQKETLSATCESMLGQHLAIPGLPVASRLQPSGKPQQTLVNSIYTLAFTSQNVHFPFSPPLHLKFALKFSAWPLLNHERSILLYRWATISHASWISVTPL
jgi:hypothetical protein